MERYENEYTFSRFDAMCQKVPEKTALYYLGEKFSYRRLRTLIDKFAAGLVRIGVKPRDSVMVYIPNCPQWIIANFAINKVGAVMVPVSPIYTAFEIAYMVEDADIKTIICLDTNFVYVREVMRKTRLERVIVTHLWNWSLSGSRSWASSSTRSRGAKSRRGRRYILSLGSLGREMARNRPKSRSIPGTTSPT